VILNENIFKSKGENIPPILANDPDLIKNNDLVHKYFSGNINKILNLTNNTNSIIENKIREIELIYLELYNIGKTIKSEKLVKIIESSLAREYYDSYWKETRSQTNDFDNLREPLKFLHHIPKIIESLQSDFLKEQYEYFKSLGIKMLDPEGNPEIIYKLSRPLIAEEKETLSNKLRSGNYKYVWVNYDMGKTNDYIYNTKKHN